MIRSTQIIVSRKVCLDCANFATFVNRVLDLDLRVDVVDNSKFDALGVVNDQLLGHKATR